MVCLQQCQLIVRYGLLSWPKEVKFHTKVYIKLRIEPLREKNRFTTGEFVVFWSSLTLVIHHQFQSVFMFSGYIRSCRSVIVVSNKYYLYLLYKLVSYSLNIAIYVHRW